MSKITVEQFAKLMVDPKVGKILKATEIETGITPKQISKITKIPNNQLYYTLNKMIDADLLEIVKQEKIKNLTESYYSSSHLSQKPVNASEDDDHMLNFSKDWLKEHSQQTIQWVMLQHHELVEALKQQLEEEKGFTAFSAHSEFDLSAEGEKKLASDLFEVLSNAEANDPNPDAKDKRHVKLQLEKW